MQLLLPPSETKRVGGRGRPRALRFEDSPLALARATVADALAETLELDDAAERLKLPPGVADQALAANRTIETSPTMAAISRYRGVVYDGLDYDNLTAAAARIARRHCWIFSGLFGIVRGDEPIPDYRVPAAANLPGIGTAGSFWRPVLAEALPRLLGKGTIIDLRSSDYAAMWRCPPARRDQVVAVRVLSPAPDGRLKVISYNSKLAKGRLAAELVRARAAGSVLEGADAVRAAWASLGGLDAGPGATGTLDLVTS